MAESRRPRSSRLVRSALGPGHGLLHSKAVAAMLAPTRLPGEMVELGGRTVRRRDQPGTEPPIVLLGGCGVPALRYDDVVPLLYGRRVIRLDRPGLGGTDWPGTLPTLADEVATLVDLVEETGARAIVVAHSMAAFHAEALARTRPDLVAALVLVDASVEQHPRRLGSGRAWLAAARAARQVMALPPVRPLGAAGEWVLMVVQSRRLRWFGTPPRSARIVAVNGEAVASVLAEQAAYARQAWDLADLRRRSEFPRIPVRVLTAASGSARRRVAEQTWLTELLAGTQQVVDDSRHMMMLDRPDLIARAVRTVAAVW
jgi:poly(3-hydroxyoctanoate) depolymerase